MNHQLGVALGSGADRGFAHIGVLKVLAENGIGISAISGASMGAVVAAHYALYLDPGKSEKVALALSNKELLKLVDLNNPVVSLIKGEKIRRFLKENLFGEATFTETKIPLAITASSLENGASYIFRRGSLVDAVMASSTLPGIFPPFEIDGLHLIDGGLADAVPLDALDLLGAEKRIGVDLYSYNLISPEKFSAKEVIFRAYRLYLSKLSAALAYKNDSRTIILRPKTDEGIETLTFSRAKPNIAAGETEAKQALTEIRKLIGKNVV